MAQDKAAEIINLASSRGGAANDGETAGSFLASARAAAGLAIEEVSGATKVKVAHLQAIEEMRADLLPTLPYTIGFVKAYARYLGLDADAVAARFRDDIAATAPATLVPPQAARTEISAGGEGARIVSVFAILAILLFGIWVVFQLTGGRNEDTVAVEEPRVRLGDAPAAQPTPRPSQRVNLIEEPAAAESANDDTPESDAALTPDVASVDEEAALPENNAIPENASAAEETTAPAASEETLSQTVEETETVESAPARPLPRRRETAPEPVIVEAELFSSAAPLYPERCARSAQDLERVTLIFDINTSGRVANPRVASSTNGCFEAEALRTIARWRFAPRTVNGAPAVAARKSATLNFRK
jgi:TonB family protein